MRKIFTLILVAFSLYSFGQIPKSGTYYFKVRFAESSYSHIDAADCKVIIDGDKIKIISLTNSLYFPFKNGEVIDDGIIIKHKSGSWIIAHKLSDKDLEEVGGCTNGPNEIDFEAKTFWMC